MAVSFSFIIAVMGIGGCMFWSLFSYRHCRSIVSSYKYAGIINDCGYHCGKLAKFYSEPVKSNLKKPGDVDLVDQYAMALRHPFQN